MDAPELSIVIPAYNESKRLGPTLEAVGTWAAAYEAHVEVIVVDDGSTDCTAEAARAWSCFFDDLRVIRYEQNQGKGRAVKVGMLAAAGRWRVFMDADNSIPVAHVDLALPLLEAGAGVVIGSRKAKGAQASARPPWWRRAWSRVSNAAVQSLLVPGVGDTQCGFKAFRAEAAEAIFARVELKGFAFDLEALTLARHLGFEIRELPVRWTDDRRSRVDPWRDFGRVVRDFAKVKARELSGLYDAAPEVR